MSRNTRATVRGGRRRTTVSDEHVDRTLAVGVLLVGWALFALWSYSSQEIEKLSRQPAFGTIEEGAELMAGNYYPGAEATRIVHAASEVFDTLQYVVLDIRLSTGEERNPGWFFLRVGDGWRFLPEGRWPHAVALGQRVFRFD